MKIILSIYPPSDFIRKGTLKKFERQVVTLTYSALIEDESGDGEAKKKQNEVY